MHRILRIKPHLRVEILDPRRLFLLGERARYLLEGGLYTRVVPLLDGHRTMEEVRDALEDRASAPEVYYALMMLEERGYAEEVGPSLEPAVAGFWESLGVEAAVAAERLADTPVAVRAFGGEVLGPLVEALRDAGVQVRDDARHHVVLTGDYLSPGLEAWAREARQRGLEWLPVKTTGTACWAGPVLPASQGPCWSCLGARLIENRPIERYLVRRGMHASPPLPPRVGVPAVARMGGAFAAMLVARWLVQGGDELHGQLWTLDFGAWRFEPHRVVRRPQCAVCGNAEWMARRALTPVVLESRPKRFTGEGQYRVLSPEETWEHHHHLVSPVTGVLNELRRVDEDNALHSVHSASFRVCPWTVDPSSEDFDRSATGKGRTVAQSRVGALAEALERYSAVFQGDEHRVRSRRSALGEEALSPSVLQHFSEAQIRTRAAGPRQRDQRTAIPLPYEDQEIDWTPVWSLTHERRRYVPTSFAYLYAPTSSDGAFCYFNSHGNAAGNCIEEAILHGFFELVERDAVALWWYNRLRRPKVDLESFGEPYFAAVEAHYRAQGLKLWVLDLTHDLEIAAFVAIVWSPSRGRAWAGAGSHFDARLALQWALLEVSQRFAPSDTASSPWDATAHTDAGFLFPDETLAARTRADFPLVRHDDLRDEVRVCVERAARAGLETLVLDQTRPDIGLSAVKVIVPGLRPVWQRSGPGRLYDVPVKMGWLGATREESQLNPVAFHF